MLGIQFGCPISLAGHAPQCFIAYDEMSVEGRHNMQGCQHNHGHCGVAVKHQEKISDFFVFAPDEGDVKEAEERDGEARCG